METGLVERVLRDLPGVLDCSVHDEGIAIVVHPEVDPRSMELRAQVALAEIGERRPLLVVGGMSTGLVDLPRAPVRRARRPFARRSPLSLVGFAVLVVALITVVPVADGGDKSERLPTVAAPSFDPPSFGRLPVVDEPATVMAAAAAVVVGPVAPAVRAAARVVRHSPGPAAQLVVAALAPVTASAVPVAVVAKAVDRPARITAAAAKGTSERKATAKGHAKGHAKAEAKAKGAGGKGAGGKAKPAKAHSGGSGGRR